MREYERISGKELDETVKTATLVEKAPPQLQEHLRLRGLQESIPVYRGYARSKKSWDFGGPADMYTGAVNQEKGQPKRKGKVKRKGKSDEGTGKRKAKAKAKAKGQEPKHNENLRKDANVQD